MQQLFSAPSLLLFAALLNVQIFFIDQLAKREIVERLGQTLLEERSLAFVGHLKFARIHHLLFLFFMLGIFLLSPRLQYVFNELWLLDLSQIVEREGRQLVLAIVGFSLLVILSGALSMVDLQLHILPDRFTQPLLWIGLLFAGLSDELTLRQALFGVIASYFVGELIYRGSFWYYQREAFGRGDVKLMAALGAWIGVANITKLLLFSSLIGLLFGSFLQLRAKLRKRVIPSAIPFGPPLLISGIILSLLR